VAFHSTSATNDHRRGQQFYAGMLHQPLCRKLLQCSEFTAALVDEFLAQLVVARCDEGGYASASVFINSQLSLGKSMDRHDADRFAYLHIWTSCFLAESAFVMRSV